MANLKAPCEWCEFGQVFKWPICKNGLLPNGPKWVNSEKFLVKIIYFRLQIVHKLICIKGEYLLGAWVVVWVVVLMCWVFSNAVLYYLGIGGGWGLVRGGP